MKRIALKFKDNMSYTSEESISYNLSKTINQAGI